MTHQNPLKHTYTANQRLVYAASEPGILMPERRAMPKPLRHGEILTRLQSATLCATDVTNLYGGLGHGHGEPQILGHETCNLVVESRAAGIEPGDYVVPLGDDWRGLAEYEMFAPVLPGADPRGIDLVYSQRGGYLDPDSSKHIKAVCLVKAWRSGISLIEPLTHVYTYYATSAWASLAGSVTVLGGGACGLFFCQFVKLFGAANRVTLIDVMDERLQFALSHGLADVTLNPVTQSEQCADLIAATSGEYAEVVFDALPGLIPPHFPNTRELGMKMLKPGGEYILYSAAENMQMPSIIMLAKGFRFHIAPYDSRQITFPQRAAHMAKVAGMIDAGLIKPEQFIARQMDFRDTEAVVKLFETYGKTAEIKVELLA